MQRRASHGGQYSILSYACILCIAGGSTQAPGPGSLLSFRCLQAQLMRAVCTHFSHFQHLRFQFLSFCHGESPAFSSPAAPRLDILANLPAP